MTPFGLDFEYLLGTEYPSCRVNKNFNIIEVNQSFIKFCNLSEEKIHGKNLWNILKPDKALKESMRNSKPDVPLGRLWFKIADLNTGNRALSAILIHDRISGHYFAALSDISSQFNLKNLLKNGEMFLNSLFENINICIGFFDRNGIIRYINSYFRDSTGLKQESITGRSIRDFTVSREDSEWLEKFSNRKDSQTKLIELNFISKKKEKHFMTTPHILVDDNGNVPGAIFILTDITELKVREKNLYISDEKFSKAFHASPAPSTVSTLEEGQYIDVNESFSKLVGYKASELIGHYVWEVGLFLKWDDRKKMITKLKKDGKLRDYEILLNSKTNGIRNFSVSAEIIELQGTKCMVWVGYDITEKIKFEKEMLSITERERYRVGQYLHDDLGQFLVGIDAMCSLIEKKLKKEKNPSLPLVTEMHQYIREATNNARMTARGLCPVNFDENGLRSAIKDMLTKTSRMFNIKYRFLDRADIVIYNSNMAINMYHIVQEAVNNAVKHGKARLIEVVYKTDDENIFLIISDNGAGFCVNNKPKTGIGLDLMKYRARAIGGTLSILSESGRGTEITLTIPKANNRQTEWDWKKNSIYE